MNKLKAKLKKQGGFTLVEMLIVVAIIAILIAISIPLVNQALEKARDSTDLANERAAKAEATLAYLGTTDVVSDAAGTAVTYTAGTASSTITGGPIYYNAKDGRLTTVKPAKYGKCTDLSHLTDTLAATGTGSNASNVLKVEWDKNGKVTLTWEAGA